MGYYYLCADYESSSYYWEDYWTATYATLEDAETAFAIKRFKLEELCRQGKGPEHASIITLYIKYQEDDSQAINQEDGKKPAEINRRTIDISAVKRGEF